MAEQIPERSGRQPGPVENSRAFKSAWNLRLLLFPAPRVRRVFSGGEVSDARHAFADSA